MLVPNPGRGSDSGFPGRIPVRVAECIFRIRLQRRIQPGATHGGFFVRVPMSFCQRIPNSGIRRVPGTVFPLGHPNADSDSAFRVSGSDFGHPRAVLNPVPSGVRMLGSGVPGAAPGILE